MIVDEVSFIGRAFFHRMHCRLQQAERAFFAERGLDPEKSSGFGDISMILVGDFGQLEPIEDVSICDDETTYALFQRGETVGIFQYESVGMQRYLKDLKPTEFADLIAMNALYRPGPMEYIPDFVARKHGRQAITYDLDACQEYLLLP